MIEKLKPPNPMVHVSIGSLSEEGLINKINEIIDTLNKLEKEIK